MKSPLMNKHRKRTRNLQKHEISFTYEALVCHRDWSSPFSLSWWTATILHSKNVLQLSYWKIERTRNQPPYCLLQLQEKMVFHLPRSGCLGTPVTLPQSLYGRTDGWTYADVRTKIFRINRLPNLLTHGAPRAPLLMKVPKILKVVTSRFYYLKRGTKGRKKNTVKL